jgi:hypothetical protein
MTSNPPDTDYPGTRTSRTGESSSIPRAARRGSTFALASLGVFLTALEVVAVRIALPPLRTPQYATVPDLEVSA